MNRERARERRRHAGETLLLVWAVAIFPNFLETIGLAPEGWAWTALRIALAVVWSVALVAFLVALARELWARRAKP